MMRAHALNETEMDVHPQHVPGAGKIHVHYVIVDGVGGRFYATQDGRRSRTYTSKPALIKAVHDKRAFR